MFVPLKYNVRNLAVRRVTTLVTTLGIGLTVAVFIALFALVEGIRNTFVETGDPANILAIRKGAESETGSIIEPEVALATRALPDLAIGEDGRPMISLERIVYVYQPRRGTGSSNVIIRGTDEIGRALRPQVRLLRGRWYRAGAREITVSRTISERFQGCSLGDNLRTGRESWTIVGVFDGGQSAYGSEMWTDATDLRDAFDRPAYSAILMRARDPGVSPVLAARIDSDRQLNLDAESEPAYFSEQTKASEPIRILGNLIALVMAVGSAFAAMNTMYAAVASRGREIAVLRALGFGGSAILLSFLLESMILAALGGVVGALLALPLNGLTTGTTNWFSFSEMTFQFRVTFPLILKGVLFAQVMGVVGGIAPALRASRQSAANALRAL